MKNEQCKCGDGFQYTSYSRTPTTMSAVLTVTTYKKKVNLKSPTLSLIITQKKIDGTTVMNAMNGKGGDSVTITNPNRIECQRTMSVMT